MGHIIGDVDTWARKNTGVDLEALAIAASEGKDSAVANACLRAWVAAYGKECLASLGEMFGDTPSMPRLLEEFLFSRAREDVLSRRVRQVERQFCVTLYSGYRTIEDAAQLRARDGMFAYGDLAEHKLPHALNLTQDHGGVVIRFSRFDPEAKDYVYIPFYTHENKVYLHYDGHYWLGYELEGQS